MELVAFDGFEGGFLCRSCRRGQAVGSQTVDLIRRIVGGGLRGVLDEPASRATEEAERLALVATEYHLDRRVRSAHRSTDLATAGWKDSAAGGAPSDGGAGPGVEPEPVAGPGSPQLGS